MIPLTRVCRYWRESIISTPENWTIISNNRRNLAVLSLERVKAAPLEILLNIYEIKKDPHFLDLLIPHLQNTKALCFAHLSTIEDLSLLNQHPMTNLRSLTLTNDGKSDWDRTIDPFESSAHVLRYLELVRIPLYPSLLNLETLTGLVLHDPWCDLHLDTLLDFLEGNRSLTSAKLRIRFIEPSLRSSRRRAAIGNRLRRLDITCGNAMDGRALLSSIALSEGAELVLDCSDDYSVFVGANDVLSGISTTHLSNLLSPTFMLYRIHSRFVQLSGPNGAALFHSHYGPNTPLVEFPLLPLANIRHFHLDAYGWGSFGPIVFHHLSSFPTLETFTIENGTDLSHLLSALLSNPSVSPSLRTLAFFNCIFTEKFMKELTQFASDRKNTASAWLHRAVIIQRDGIFPSITSIRKLREHVSAVDARIAEKLPVDL